MKSEMSSLFWFDSIFVNLWFYFPVFWTAILRNRTKVVRFSTSSLVVLGESIKSVMCGVRFNALAEGIRGIHAIYELFSRLLMHREGENRDHHLQIGEGACDRTPILPSLMSIGFERERVRD